MDVSWEDMDETTSKFSEEMDEIERIDLRILRSHLYFEHIMEEILEKFLEKPKNIVKFRYKQKMDLMASLGLINEETYQNLKLMNRMRNHIAHNVDLEKDISEKLEIRIKQLNELNITEKEGDIDEVPISFELMYKSVGTVSRLHSIFNNDNIEVKAVNTEIYNIAKNAVRNLEGQEQD
jgi:uncharacterized protein YutE (UPF0331/DUF86 family)